jgi:hypothetical protein
MINFIKNDFVRVRWTLNYLLHREIPFGVFLAYYVIVGTLLLPISLIAWVGCKIYYMNMIRDMKKRAL